MGNWLFGCDLCQQACPVNDSASPAAEARFLLPEDRRELRLEDLFEMSREEYLEWFRQNPIPPERGPAGRTAFKFYVLTDSVEATRD